MSDEIAPYLRPPLSFEGGRMNGSSLEDSIRDNIRLILHNEVQGIAKGKSVAADPAYGAALPHHEFRFGRPQDVVRAIRVAVRRLEPRLELEKVEYAQKTPGRYLPYTSIRMVGTVRASGEPITLDFEIKE